MMLVVVYFIIDIWLMTFYFSYAWLLRKFRDVGEIKPLIEPSLNHNI